MSSIDCGGPYRLIQHTHEGSTTNYTKSEANSWASIDLGKGRSLVVSDYCLRHGCGNGRYRLQSWDFEGSNDGSNWTMLKAHKNDNSLPAQGFSVAAWEVEGANQAYRYFRIRQTGKNSLTMTGRNSSGNHYLCCGGIELYGVLLSQKPPGIAC
jgi:hypothetical protein